MQKNKTQVVPALLVILMISTLITSVLAANSLLAVRSSTPTVTLSIPAISETQTAATGAASASSEKTGIRSTTSGSQTSSEGASDGIIRDEQTVWSGDTQIDIFSISYDNAAGTTTVNSAYGDKVIAPGTSDQYYFRIENDGNVSVDYSLTAEGDATFTLDGESYTIPIQVKFSDSGKAYLVGSENTWEDVDALDTVSDSGTLSAGNYAQYTLDWQWPYEQDDVAEGDAYDTMLGNLAASGEDLSVTIRFAVTASNDADATAVGGLTKTGDNTNAVLWFALAILSVCGLIFLFLMRKRRGNEG
ncbi:MAG: hypothetical protein LUC83_01900 [Clostridiales bacterium]|nr:hypothetical protein [Clostridiales bacterium]